MLFGAKWADTKALGKVPSSDYAIYERCKDETGFVPFYIRKIQHGAAKRAFTYGYLLRLNQGSTEVSAALKQVRAGTRTRLYIIVMYLICFKANRSIQRNQ